MYGGVKINKYIGSSRNCIELNNTELNRLQTRFKEIKSIHSQALNEVMNAVKKFRRNCPVIKLFKGVSTILNKTWRFFNEFFINSYESIRSSKWIKYSFQQSKIDEFLRDDLHANVSVLNISEVEQFFKRLRDQLERNEIVGILNEYEKIFSRKLTPNQVNRIMTFVRLLEGTPTSINNSLVSWSMKLDFYFSYLLFIILLMCLLDLFVLWFASYSINQCISIKGFNQHHLKENRIK